MTPVKKLFLSIAVLFFAVVIQAQTPVDSLFGKNEQAENTLTAVDLKCIMKLTVPVSRC